MDPNKIDARSSEVPQGAEMQPELKVANTIEQRVDGSHDKIDDLVGPQMQSEASPTEALYKVDEKKAAPKEDERAKEFAKVERMIDDMERSAGDLIAKSMEHRVNGPLDRLPFRDQYRSHRVASQEAEIVSRLQNDLQRLEKYLTEHNIAFDISELKAAVESIGMPGGVTKVLGTVFSGVRRAHREWTAADREHLKTVASRLRRAAHDQSTNLELAA